MSTQAGKIDRPNALIKKGKKERTQGLSYICFETFKTLEGTIVKT